MMRLMRSMSFLTSSLNVETIQTFNYILQKGAKINKPHGCARTKKSDDGWPLSGIVVPLSTKGRKFFKHKTEREKNKKQSDARGCRLGGERHFRFVGRFRAAQ